MPKSLVVGNGTLLVNFEEHLLMSDFYFPHVGMEDHTTFKHVHRVGIFVDGVFSWLNDGKWKMQIEYHYDSLVGNSFAMNDELQVELHFEDFIPTIHNILVRRITVKNKASTKREIRLFFSNDFHMYGEKLQDTAEYEPFFNGILHYRKKRYFLVGGQWEVDGEGLFQFATGKSEYAGKEGTWRDAEDGNLEGNSIEQGSVDSTISFKRDFIAHEEKILNLWIIASKNYHETKELDTFIKTETPRALYVHTLDYWKHWCNKQSYAFGNLDEKIVNLFKRSLLIIKSQIDHSGAIMAANDSDIIKFNRDTYTYMWARDASFAAVAMGQAKYAETAKNFFTFCSKLLTDEGYMLHKYNPDGSLGSSWHAKFKNGELQLPIQEDETALPLWALWENFKSFGFLEFVHDLYQPFIKKAGMFLAHFIDPHTNLPLPTYDLWEEQRGIFTYTASTVFGGLIAAAGLAEATANYEDATLFTKKAQQLKTAILQNLYDNEEKRFLKKMVFKEGTLVTKDKTVDASLAFIWRMGVLSVHDERVISTMKAIKEKLWLPTFIGGIARYENDYYQREFDSSTNPQLVGNPWLITTLWYADWLIEIAKGPEDLKDVEKLLLWVIDRANKAGILPEQVDPLNGKPLSVAPLTWSHSEFVITVLSYRKKMKELGMCDDCI